jgi:hypothetical protein
MDVGFATAPTTDDGCDAKKKDKNDLKTFL